MSKKSLSQLCRDYVWEVLVAWDMDNFDYTSNRRRMEIHHEMAKLLNVPDPHVGYLKWALNYLESSAGLPSTLPEYEDWESVARRCGLTLHKRLLRFKEETHEGQEERKA